LTSIAADVEYEMREYSSNMTEDHHRSGSTSPPRQNIHRTRSKEIAPDAADFSRELYK
jgi:hypothetical protein